MFTTVSSLLGMLDILVNKSGQLIFSRRSQQEPIVNNTITIAADAAATLTAAQLLGGIIEGPITAARTYTLDTAANIDAAITNPAVGDTFMTQIINTAGSAVAITVAAGAGITVKGTATVGQGKVSYIMFLRTGAGAWTAYTSLSA